MAGPCKAGAYNTQEAYHTGSLISAQGHTQRQASKSAKFQCSSRGLSSGGHRALGAQRPWSSGATGRTWWPTGIKAGRVRASSAVPEKSEGDAKVQQMLVELLQAQMGEARVVDLVEQRSQELRDIAQQSSADLDNIASRTMRGVDALGNRMLRELDLDIAGLERELKIANLELEASNRDLEAFEIRMTSARNEGLFFKSLHSPTRSRMLASPALPKHSRGNQAVVLDAASRESLVRAYRQVLYAGLSVAIASLVWNATAAFLGGTSMRFTKLVAHGMIVTGLMIQVVYDKVVTEKDLHTVDEESEEQ